MSYIRETAPGDATGDLEQIYSRISGERGKVANIMTVQSLNPGAMDAHLDLYVQLMFGSSELSRLEREMIAVVVSATNNCEYCVNHHSVPLQAYLKDDTLVEQIAGDWRGAELSDRQRAILEYAETLTTSPGDMGSGDIDSLRGAGLSDEDILSINMIAAYFNFVNRIALGLGVEFSDTELQGYAI